MPRKRPAGPTPATMRTEQNRLPDRLGVPIAPGEQIRVVWEVTFEPPDSNPLKPLIPAPEPTLEAEAHLADPNDIDVWRCLSCLNDFHFKPGTRSDYCPACGKGDWARRVCRIGQSGPPSHHTVKLAVRGTDGSSREERTKRIEVGLDGLRAEEVLAFDHRHPEVTTKSHSVSQLVPSSRTWQDVHREAVEYPAKHRRSASKKEK
jgi:hypothetical protein